MFGKNVNKNAFVRLDVLQQESMLSNSTQSTIPINPTPLPDMYASQPYPADDMKSEHVQLSLQNSQDCDLLEYEKNNRIGVFSNLDGQDGVSLHQPNHIGFENSISHNNPTSDMLVSSDLTIPTVNHKHFTNAEPYLLHSPPPRPNSCGLSSDDSSSSISTIMSSPSTSNLSMHVGESPFKRPLSNDRDALYSPAAKRHKSNVKLVSMFALSQNI